MMVNFNLYNLAQAEFTKLEGGGGGSMLIRLIRPGRSSQIRMMVHSNLGNLARAESTKLDLGFSGSAAFSQNYPN